MLSMTVAIQRFAEFALQNKIKAFKKMTQEEAEKALSALLASELNFLNRFSEKAVFSLDPIESVDYVRELHTKLSLPLAMNFLKLLEKSNVKDAMTKIFYESFYLYAVYALMPCSVGENVHPSSKSTSLYFSTKVKQGDIIYDLEWEEVPSSFMGRVFSRPDLPIDEDHNLFMAVTSDGFVAEISWVKPELGSAAPYVGMSDIPFQI